MALSRRKLSTLGQILIKFKKISPEELKMALQLQKDKYPQKRLGEILVDEGFIGSEELNHALAFQFLYPHIEISRFKLNEDVLSLIPKEIAFQFQVIPLDRFDTILTVAMVNPLDALAKEAVHKVTGLEVRPLVVSHKELEEALELIYKK